MPFEAALADLPEPPIYQKIFEKALHLNQLGMNPNRIASSPRRRSNDRNQSPPLDQVTLPRNVKTNRFGQQRPFSHPVVPVIPVFRRRLHLGQAQKNGKIHQSAIRIA